MTKPTMYGVYGVRLARAGRPGAGGGMACAGVFDSHGIAALCNALGKRNELARKSELAQARHEACEARQHLDVSRLEISLVPGEASTCTATHALDGRAPLGGQRQGLLVLAL